MAYPRRSWIIALAIAAVALVAPLAAEGQSPSSPPVVAATLPDLGTLEQLCATNTPDEAARATCLDVVHRYLIPGSGTVSSAVPVTATLFVPDVRGYAEQDMKYTFDGAGLVAGHRTRAYDPEICVGCVVSTDPDIGAEVPPGSTISYVVSRGPEPTPRPTSAPGLGDSQSDPNMRVTVVKVDWNARGTYFKPDTGKQWVAVYVRYKALEAGDYNAGEDWDAVDNDGFDGEDVLFSPKAQELTDGRLRKGQTIQGWITYEFATGVKSVTLTYRDGIFGDEEHTWVIKRR